MESKASPPKSVGVKDTVASLKIPKPDRLVIGGRVAAEPREMDNSNASTLGSSPPSKNNSKEAFGPMPSVELFEP